MPFSFDKLEALIKDPLIKPDDVLAYVDVALHQNSIDDRLYVLEKLLVLMARLAEDGGDRMKALSSTLQDFVIDLLYKDLPHPPASFLSHNFPELVTPNAAGGPNPKYASRSADGSHYVPYTPAIGMAGAPYARSVGGITPLDPTALPDPRLAFDLLLARPKGPNGVETFNPHPGGVSSLFFGLADIIIHCIFNTNPRDWTINDASSYLDLSMVYGSNEKEVKLGRRQDGSGKMWDDVFLDKRLLNMPPAACALLVLLCRNHNFVAERILAINERGNLKPISELKDDASIAAQDEEIFARSRLVNCGLFMQMILGDYVGAILGMVRDGYNWRLDPLKEFRRANHEPSPRGTGNVVSIEFNLLYRWHATLSKADTKWTEAAFKKLFNGEVDVTEEEFHVGVRNAVRVPEDPRQWTFSGLTRDEKTNRFSDADLAKILKDSTQQRAAAYGAKGIPSVMKVIEVLGIEQGRSWGACSLNEFRKFIGLKPYKSFSEWNNDPEISKTAAMLYKDIDNLELHVGMQAEQSKEPGPGAGLCPGYTISRAILADAVALTKGDPYLTVHFTPFDFTTFGYNDCQYDPLDGTYGGGFLTKLLFRHLPEHYPSRSAYAHFPFLDPSYIKTLNLTPNSPVTTRIPTDKYNFDYPKDTKIISVASWSGASSVLQPDFHELTTKGAFTSFTPARLRNIMQDAGGKVPDTRSIRKLLVKNKAIYAQWFAAETKKLIGAASIAHPGKSVYLLDIARDVLNILPIKFIVTQLAGLPVDSEKDLEAYYHKFEDVCRYVHVNIDQEHDWHLRETSTATFKEFGEEVTSNLGRIGSWLGGVDSLRLRGGDVLKDLARFVQGPPDFIKELHDATQGEKPSDAAAALFAEVVPNAVQFSQALVHTLESYLRAPTPAGVPVSVDEALAKDPLLWGTYAAATTTSTLPDGTKVTPDDKVWVSIKNAIDAADVSKVDAGWMGVSRQGLLDQSFFSAVASGVLLEILKLPQLVQDGRVHKFVETRNNSPVQLYVGAKGSITPFPFSMKVKYASVAK